MRCDPIAIEKTCGATAQYTVPNGDMIWVTVVDKPENSRIEQYEKDFFEDIRVSSSYDLYTLNSNQEKVHHYVKLSPTNSIEIEAIKWSSGDKVIVINNKENKKYNYQTTTAISTIAREYALKYKPDSPKNFDHHLPNYNKYKIDLSDLNEEYTLIGRWFQEHLGEKDERYTYDVNPALTYHADVDTYDQTTPSPGFSLSTNIEDLQYTNTTNYQNMYVWKTFDSETGKSVRIQLVYTIPSDAEPGVEFSPELAALNYTHEQGLAILQRLLNKAPAIK